MTETWQTVPASPAPCVCCPPRNAEQAEFQAAAEAGQQAFAERHAAMVRQSAEYLRLLAKLQHANELAKEWKAIALSMREVNVQLAAANDGLVAEAQGLPVAA